MSNKNIAIVITFVLVVGLGSYVYQDIRERGTGVSQNSSTTPLVVSSGIEATGDYTLEQVSIEKTKIPVPNLNRPLTFSSNLSPEVKKIITDGIKRLADILKSDSARFDVWLDLGSYRKQSGDYEGAWEAWEYAAVLAPESYVPWNNLGDLYGSYLKNYPKAEENFKKAITLKQDYIGGYRSLYELYRYSYKEKSNLADDILLEGLSRNPKSTDIMILLAQYYKEIGNKDNARTYYQKALTEAKAQGNASLATLLEKEITNL